MIVRQKNNLKDGQTYWYVSVTYNCHWIIKVCSDIFRSTPTAYTKCMNPKSVDDMIIFDNEKDAQSFANSIQQFVNQYIIR